MKNLFSSISMILFAGLMHAQDAGIGDEFIAPLKFPKFTFTGEYELNRRFHGFADSALRSDLERRFDTSLSFEAGLTKYFNAGALFGVGIDSFKDPIHLRLGIFAKPYYPLTERFAVFVRVSTGIALEFAVEPSAKAYYGSFDKGGNIERVYKQQEYRGFPFGGFGAAALGIEVFPFSRVGLALEWGIRATILHSRKNIPLVTKVEDKSGVPDAFNFMLYELPVMLSLHWII